MRKASHFHREKLQTQKTKMKWKFTARNKYNNQPDLESEHNFSTIPSQIKYLDMEHHNMSHNFLQFVLLPLASFFISY